jgi:hypothetical protein
MPPRPFRISTAGITTSRMLDEWRNNYSNYRRRSIGPTRDQMQRTGSAVLWRKMQPQLEAQKKPRHGRGF